MIKCIEYHQITLSSNQCKTYQNLVSNISSLLQIPISNIKIFFIDGKQNSTEIQSDADVIGLKYVVKQNQLNFKVKVIKSRQQMQSQVNKELIGGYLNNIYETIAHSLLQMELREVTNSYLQEMYGQISQKQAIKLQIEREQISRYFAKMTQHCVGNQIVSKVAIRERRNKNMRVSPQKQIKNKFEFVQNLVKSAIDSFMPQMVKELSSRIMQQIKFNKLRNNSLQMNQNPEQL